MLFFHYLMNLQFLANFLNSELNEQISLISRMHFNMFHRVLKNEKMNYRNNFSLSLLTKVVTN